MVSDRIFTARHIAVRPMTVFAVTLAPDLEVGPKRAVNQVEGLEREVAPDSGEARNRERKRCQRFGVFVLTCRRSATICEFYGIIAGFIANFGGVGGEGCYFW